MSNLSEATLTPTAVNRRGYETPHPQPRQPLELAVFRRVLDHERARTDRSNQPFTVVTFAPRDESRRSLTRLIAILSQRLRTIDELGWYSEGVLGALLPYTEKEEAWRLADDVVASVPLAQDPPACDVLVYPSNWPAPMTAEEEAGEVRSTGQLEPLFAQPLPWWKRGIDVVGSMLGLILLAPLLLLVAIAVKCTSAGPALFTQSRTGLGGRRFRMVKFRTMVANAEHLRSDYLPQNEQDGPAFKITNDPRVTPLGRWLRITHIDELPQLWNVLKGEMTLVGPRPLPHAEAEACEVWQRRRHDVTPGLTCLWQAEGRSRDSFAHWMRLDLRYIRQRSLWLDLKLLLITAKTMLHNRKDR